MKQVRFTDLDCILINCTQNERIDRLGGADVRQAGGKRRTRAVSDSLPDSNVNLNGQRRWSKFGRILEVEALWIRLAQPSKELLPRYVRGLPDRYNPMCSNQNWFKELVRKRGLNNITVDEIVDQVSPTAREIVPNQIKRELVQRIRDFLLQQNPPENR